MDYKIASAIGKLVLLEHIIKAAHSSTKPEGPIWSMLPTDCLPVTFDLLVDVPYPLAMQRTWLKELEGINLYSVEDDPQIQNYDRLLTYTVFVKLGQAHDERDELHRRLPPSYFDGARRLLPSTIEESLNVLGVEVKMAVAAKKFEEDPQNAFGPLRICADGLIRCGRIPLELQDRHKAILSYLIRYPKFHSYVDIARELFPGGDHYKSQAAQRNVQEYKYELSKILKKATDEVEIQLVKYDQGQDGYRLVLKEKRKRKDPGDNISFQK